MKKNIYLTLRTLLVSLFMSTGFYAHSQVVINEYSSANLSSILDDYGKSEDWVELYNSGSSPVNLSGYYLSDDTLQATKWQIPAGTTISANGHLRFWCSGRNTSNGTNFHTNFKFTQTKNNAEVITISDAGGTIIDKTIIKKTKLGHSRGRSTDGASTWAIFTSPSCGSSNTSTPFTSYAEKPVMDIAPGFYSGPVTVTITNTEPSANVMRYTTDGTEPTAVSPLYSGPVTINSTQVLKAVTFSNDASILSGFIEFNTYFINETHTIPVVSVSGTELETLANGDNTLRPHGAFEYFDKTGIRKAKSYGEYNSHGQDSWANDQRSIDFVARDEIGYSKAIKEKLFTLSNRTEFQRVILRAAGDDNYPAAHRPENEGSAHLRDAFFQNLCKENGLNLDVRTAEKCVVYIDGIYWGVYDLREIPDDHDYTEHYYNQDKYNLQYILTWGNTWAEYGGNQALDDWNSLKSYILNNDMSVSANYNYVTSQLDVTSLADYVIVHALSNSSDWLNYNTGWWRGLNPNGGHKKWGYILWDNDASFAFYINYTGIADTSASADLCNVEALVDPWSDPEQHITVLNKLMQNPGFKQYYVMRYNDLLNTAFSCDYILAYLDSTKNVIDPEMTRHAQRWFGTYSEWQANYNRLRHFIERRCGTNPDMNMTNCYGLTGPYDVIYDVSPANSGSLQVNSLTVNSLPWTSSYYGGLDIKLKAIPDSAHAFQNWSANVLTFASPLIDSATINLNANDSVIAHFNLINSIPELNNNVFNAMVYPNVFSESAKIVFSLPEKNRVSIKLRSITGKELMNITNGEAELNKGSYSYDLNLNRSNFAQGMYLVEIRSGNYIKCLKVVYN